MRPLCALDTHFCRARTGASSTADFYPTVNAALRHKSADSEEDHKGLGCHLGQFLTMGPANSRSVELAFSVSQNQIDGAFQTGALLRALPSENNHGHHIEVPFQTEVLKISHFKVPFGMKDFEGYN